MIFSKAITVQVPQWEKWNLHGRKDAEILNNSLEFSYEDISLPHSETMGLAAGNYLIQKNNGDINETAGDGLMIIFQDKDRESHARTAVSTANAIYYKTLKVNAELRGKFEPSVVNIGINSGKVFMGATKFEGMSAARWSFTASGLTTVLAARIAGLATDGKILLGPETVNRLQEEFLTQPFGEHRLKNIKKTG